MRATLGFLLCLPLLAGCGSQTDQPTQVAFASYEDCVLGKLGRGQSTIASQAIIDACASKYPKPSGETAAVRRILAPPGAGLFDDLIPPSNTSYTAPAPAPSPEDSVWDEWKDDPLVSAPPTNFRGYACTSDCSGHEAGYQWAEENGISDASNCGGNSQSFIDGCKAWTESD